MIQTLQSAGFAQIFPVMRQQYPDPTFPTVEFPNPEEPEAVAELLRLGKKVSADIVIALDPDADRCAVGIRLRTARYACCGVMKLGRCWQLAWLRRGMVRGTTYCCHYHGVVPIINGNRRRSGLGFTAHPNRV